METKKQIAQRLSQRLPKLFISPNYLDLTKSFRGGDRVFFVGEYWWDQVNRRISLRFGYGTGHIFAQQEVKVHGRWHFVRMPKWEADAIVEMPLVNRFMRWKYPEGSPFRSLPSRGSPRLAGPKPLSQIITHAPPNPEHR